MKKLLLSFTIVIALLYLAALYVGGIPEGDFLWVLRSQLLNFTGIMSIAFMSLIMYISIRPQWLESVVGGMDKVYRTHKWAGITAILLGAVHWLVKLSGGPIKDLIGKAGRPAKAETIYLLDSFKGLSKDIAEWGIYIVLIMLVITLWKKFPYNIWRLLHKSMPILYLAFVFHTLCFVPLLYWQQPIGILLALLLIVGSVSSLIVLSGKVGHRKKMASQLLQVRELAHGVTEVVCKITPQWPGHKAGQFAFVAFNSAEGAHPFTIASANNGHSMTFQIKALGDYTKNLYHKLTLGQAVSIEGPYGQFDFQRGKDKQIWIAGGIGVTPFLAGLEEAVNNESKHIEFIYCPSTNQDDPFVDRLTHLAAQASHVNLYVLNSHEERLSAAILAKRYPNLADYEIWFCGPGKFAKDLRYGLEKLGLGDVPFHQEYFEMR